METSRHSNQQCMTGTWGPGEGEGGVTVSQCHIRPPLVTYSFCTNEKRTAHGGPIGSCRSGAADCSELLLYPIAVCRCSCCLQRVHIQRIDIPCSAILQNLPNTTEDIRTETGAQISFFQLGQNFVQVGISERTM